MSTAAPTENGRLVHHPPSEAATSTRARPSAAEHLDLSLAFAGTVARYLLGVLPQVRRELAHWHATAAAIPNPELRQTAGAALRKRGNIEGAALFATLAPAGQRQRTVRALVAFQTAYNYLDALSELPSPDPLANGAQLHQALLSALRPGTEHPDYYAHNPQRGDGGYLTAMLEACSEALAGLPSFPALAATAAAAAARIVDFQAMNLAESQGGHDALQRWGTQLTPPGSGLAWWETAGGGGSSLAVHALIAASAKAQLERSDAREIDRAYFPRIGALHSLLDSLVDRDEDRSSGQRSLLGYYRSPADAATHLRSLATRARTATQRLPDRHAHRVILTAMCSYYLSAPQSATPEAHTITSGLGDALGIPLHVATLMFRTRRLLTASLSGEPYN